MALSQESIGTLESAIVEGTFPDSDEFLKADLSVQSIPLLQASLSKARDDLSLEIQAISKEEARDVDDWITQAKKAQNDIARCKLEARQIVEEHERVEAAKIAASQGTQKVELLEAELSFNQALQHHLESIGEIGQVLDEAGRHITACNPTEAVELLRSATTSILRLPTGASRNVLVGIDGELRRTAGTYIGNVLDGIYVVERDATRGRIEFPTTNPSNKDVMHKIPMSRYLDSLASLDMLSEVSNMVLVKLERFLLPLLSKKTDTYPSSCQVAQEKMTFTFATVEPDAVTMLQIVKDTVKFLYAALPETMKSEVAQQLMPKLIDAVLVHWVDPAVPHELSEMKSLEKLRSKITDLESTLASISWPGRQGLNDWLDQIPRTWLNKRRMGSLNKVRLAFRSAAATTRQVERIERQLIEKEASDRGGDVEEDDWNASWDDDAAEPESEVKNNKESDDDDEGASGWDFETESNHSADETKTKTRQNDGHDTGEAWGWDDESPVEGRKTEGQASIAANGNKGGAENEEVVLKELYTITDIPDYILEVIGKDIFDSQTLSTSQSDIIFTSSAPTAALQALPTLVLAMFRATAPTHYSHARNLSNMHLYNDASYITQKVGETIDAQTRPVLQPALDAMTKFARQTYTRELDTQRTILSDLLDGAQGFVSCNSDQYRELSASAVSAVVDRIRQLQQEYGGILGQSHLLQTIGSLISMVIGKVIGDIEDLEDISEKESDRLVEYCQQIISLEDLFMATKPTDTNFGQDAAEVDESPQQVSTIAFYVPNYFRFQYLAEILKSSLADIKFMWIEGGLKSDFSADEVVDLIKALFAESNHRRSAISAIRGST